MAPSLGLGTRVPPPCRARPNGWVAGGFPLVPLVTLLAYVVIVLLYLVSGSETVLCFANCLVFVVTAATLLETSDLFHPFTMIPAVHGMYSLLPLVSLATTENLYWDDSLIAVFGTEGGTIVFASASLGIVLSWFAYRIQRLYSESPAPQRAILQLPEPIGWALVMAAGILTSAFLAKTGLGAFQAGAYAEGFRTRLTSGMGIYAYGNSLAMIGLAVFLAQPKISFRGAATAVLVFLTYFAATGERKHLLIPAIMCTAAYHCRVRKLPVFTLIPMGVALYVLFQFFGYARIQTDDGADVSAISFYSFWSYFLDNIGSGELTPIYGTASAAYLGFVDALGHLGDYLSAWQMAIPQFLTGTNFLAVNDRFALAYDPVRAYYDRMGWGFSLFGEAYMALGNAGPMIIAACLCGVAMLLYRMAERYRFQRLPGALWFTFIYYQIWSQRNGFAHTLKDWFIYMAIPLVMTSVLATLASGANPSASKPSSTRLRGQRPSAFRLARRPQG